jgi:hypothetical protein
MFDYIEQLREKSERTKKFIAFSLSFFVVGIILFFWFFSVFPQSWQEKQISDRVHSVEPSPISALSQILSQGFSGIGENVSKIKMTANDFFGATQIINNATSTEMKKQGGFATTTNTDQIQVISP